MASIRKEIRTYASVDEVWDAIRDYGALHIRLVPGFVVATRLEPGARIVTFGNGSVIREPIVAIDEEARRLVWTAEGAKTSHYNGAVQAFADGEHGTRVVWIADFLPDEAARDIGAAMEAGAAVMKKTLDRLSEAHKRPR